MHRIRHETPGDAPATGHPLAEVELTGRARRAYDLTGAALAAAADGGADRLDELSQQAADRIGVMWAQIAMLVDRVLVAGGGPGVTAPEGVAEHMPRRGSALAFEDTLGWIALRADETVVVTDARRDTRVCSVPSVVEGAIQAYLGAPLRSGEGFVVGVLCVWQPSPYVWSEDEITVLEAFAGDICAELERLERVGASA